MWLSRWSLTAEGMAGAVPGQTPITPSGSSTAEASPESFLGVKGVGAEISSCRKSVKPLAQKRTLSISVTVRSGIHKINCCTGFSSVLVTFVVMWVKFKGNLDRCVFR